ncbi:MAG: 6-phospho-beta-glucosidase [Bryobacteraceae bacterium]|nr:6-phospho-beta-glucosidase [Bryobacteraceae bacterium]
MGQYLRGAFDPRTRWIAGLSFAGGTAGRHQQTGKGKEGIKMKITILGCGLRTPLLLSGLLNTGRLPDEIVLYDSDSAQSALMGTLGRATAPDSPTRLRVAGTPQDAIDGSDYVLCAIRPAGMSARARDERIALDHGYAGQETVGPAGAAMAWRTMPAVLGYARLIESLAPSAWLINFTNPAGLVTQAVQSTSSVKTIGICDTPAELFYRVSLSLGADLSRVRCDYFGLNHLGFIRRVEVDGEDRTESLLEDDQRLRGLYPAGLFPPELIREIGLIPTEYVFFYLRPDAARANQLKVGKTRGEELLTMNGNLYAELSTITREEGTAAGLRRYARYLNHRNASYFRLEGDGKSAFADEAPDWDPFAAVTGYHRIAVDTIQALSGAAPAEIVLNVANRGALPTLLDSDVVEVNCAVNRNSIVRAPAAAVPRQVFGLIESTKAFERSLIRASLSRSAYQLQWALAQHPLIRDWDVAGRLAEAFSLRA